MGKVSSIFLSVLAVIAIILLFKTCSSDNKGSALSLQGAPLPEFAAPLASGSLDGDVNITPADTTNKDATPACDVHLPGAFNSCDASGKPLLLAFFAPGKASCEREVKLVDRVVTGMRHVETVAVAMDVARTEAAVASKRLALTLPVIYDRDGAMASLFRVAVCPTLVFSTDDTIQSVKFGTLGEAELRQELSSITADGSGSR